MTPREIGSSPVNGSSYIISIGSSAMERASATRRAMPPESSEGMSSAAPRRPTAWSFISTRSRIRASGSRVCSRIWKCDVVERRHVGEQRAELEQHSDAPAQREQPLVVELVDHLAGNAHLPRLGQRPADETQQRRLAAAADNPMMATTLPSGITMLMSFRTWR